MAFAYMQPDLCVAASVTPPPPPTVRAPRGAATEIFVDHRGNVTTKKYDVAICAQACLQTV